MIETLLLRLLERCFKISEFPLFAIFLFTLAINIATLPLSALNYMNAIRYAKTIISVNNIKKKYWGDKETINSETLKIYKAYRYQPFISLVVVFVKLWLLSKVINTFKLYETGETSGINLGILTFVTMSTLFMCFIQSKFDVSQRFQSKTYKIVTTSVSTFLYLAFAMVVSSSVSLYWAYGNILSAVLVFAFNALFQIYKCLDVNKINESNDSLKDFSPKKPSMTPEQKRKEKADYKRFFNIKNKNLVVFSEGSGFYKYFRRLLMYLINNSDIIIHYVTTDYNDQIFDIAKTENQIVPYFISDYKVISLFMKLDAKIVLMTVPDLDRYYLKRSYANKNIEYIFIDHGVNSPTLAYRNHALDNYDTIFCCGQYMVDEIRKQEEVYGLSPKNIIPYGYGLLDDLRDAYAHNDLSHITEYALIAPSYQEGNILDSCLDEVVSAVSKYMKVIIRPHPQYIKRKSVRWAEIQSKYQNVPDVSLEQDFSSNETIYKAAVLITDWSSIAYEYAFSTFHPVLFANTPCKIINPDYQEVIDNPFDFWIRSKVGVEVSDMTEKGFETAIKHIVSCRQKMESDIKELNSSLFCNIGKSEVVGGEYILSKLIS